MVARISQHNDGVLKKSLRIIIVRLSFVSVGRHIKLWVDADDFVLTNTNRISNIRTDFSYVSTTDAPDDLGFDGDYEWIIRITAAFLCGGREKSDTFFDLDDRIVSSVFCQYFDHCPVFFEKTLLSRGCERRVGIQLTSSVDHARGICLRTEGVSLFSCT